ncbi:hypothetical protein LJR084_006818 [Variovorax sp. LjRoot84]|uniref:hypothetical protein n=1 Tax=Variovorax sp. LjRoot84 TaxID=3342340 RepID=UPI003ECF1555
MGGSQDDGQEQAELLATVSSCEQRRRHREHGGREVDAAKDIVINGGQVTIQAATNQFGHRHQQHQGEGLTANQFIWHDPTTGINAKRTISAADTLALFGTTVNASGTLTLNTDTLDGANPA